MSATRAPRKTSRERAQAIADAGGVMTRREIGFVIVGLLAAMFLSSLNQTVVGTSMRVIADDLGGLALQAWVTTAFLIVSTIVTPIYGKLSDLYGRRPLFIAAIAIFLAGSLMCGFANSIYELAGYRALQGLGAGGLMSLPLTIIGDILSPRERARYQGLFFAVFGVSSVIGPLVGGFFAGADQILFTDGWRWVFFINVPLGGLALAAVVAFLHLPHTRRTVRIDWWGAAAVVLGTVPLLLVAEQGRVWGWDSPAAIACYVLAALGAIAFVVVERAMGDDALIPLKLFRHPTFSMATVLGVLVGFGMFGALMTLPLYLQLVDGATPTEAGWLTIPLVLGLMVASIASGQLIARTGRYRVFPILGTGFMAGGFLLLTTVDYTSPVWFLMVGMVLIGLGLGQLMQTLTLASQNAVGPRDLGAATSTATFFRQIGGTLGVAIVFSVLFSRLGEAIAAAFGRSDLLRGALDAALDPAVAHAPRNAAIMDAVWGPVAERIAAQLPPGADLSDPAVRGGVVDQALPALRDAIASGAAGAGDMSGSLDADSSFLTGADPRLAAPFLDGFADASVTVFWVSATVVLIAFALSFFLKTPPLREKSAMQERIEAERAAGNVEA